MKQLRFAAVILLVTGPVIARESPSPSKSIPEVVDFFLQSELKELNVQPAPLADDATLLRRITLDLTGRIPTVRDLDEYLASTAPDKKTKLVDRLLNSPSFKRHQLNELETMLAPRSANGRRRSSGGLREYLKKAIDENRSWDAIFRDLILADDRDASRKGSSEFLKSRIKDLDRLTTDVSVLFFGVNVSCAQCHDHPLVSDWKQDHYYGLKAFFARTYEHGSHLGEREVGLVEFKTTANETKRASLMFLTGKIVADPTSKLSKAEIKKLSDTKSKQKKRSKSAGVAPPPAPRFSARQALAELALEPSQREFFSKSIVNRLWYRLFGLGLVNPLDQMHSANIASHPELLNWLAQDLANHNYDLQRLIRGLVLSEAYARSSRYEGNRWPAYRSYGVAQLRALTPIQLATSLNVATISPEQFSNKIPEGEFERKLESIENRSRGFARLIEHPDEDFQIGVGEALLFSNAEQVRRDFLTESGDRLVGYLLKLNNPEQALGWAVKSVLSRPIAPEEKRVMLEYLGKRQDRPKEAYQQLVWALLTSAEFRFNH